MQSSLSASALEDAAFSLITAGCIMNSSQVLLGQLGGINDPGCRLDEPEFAGLVECFIMCLVLASAEAFTLYVLSKMAERYQGRTYGILIRKALGRKLSAGMFPFCNASNTF